MYVDKNGEKITVRFTNADFKTGIAKITISYLKKLPSTAYDKIIQLWTTAYTQEALVDLMKLEKKGDTWQYNRERKQKAKRSKAHILRK